MISVAESVTGGLIMAAIVNKPGVTSVFKGGIVAYSTDIKMNILNIPQEIVDKNRCVNKDCAELLALNVSKLFNSEYGFGITGFAEKRDGQQAYISISKNNSIINTVLVSNIDSFKIVNITGKQLINVSIDKIISGIKMGDANSFYTRNYFREALKDIGLYIINIVMMDKQ